MVATFTLQTVAVPRLAELGAVVELRELPYGQMRAAMAAADKPGESADRLLAASLHVDGEPLGYPTLLALPARFSGAIAETLETAMRLHGIETAGPAQAEAPKG